MDPTVIGVIIGFGLLGLLVVGLWCWLAVDLVSCKVQNHRAEVAEARRWEAGRHGRVVEANTVLEALVAQPLVIEVGGEKEMIIPAMPWTPVPCAMSDDEFDAHVEATLHA